MGMKAERDTAAVERAEHHDVTIPEGCLLCGGELQVRFTPDGTASYCQACRWISRPHVHRENGSVFMAHPAGGLA